ncbi:hypothetical protein BLSTO_05131 [Blastocystis sp. subtype 1]
MSCGQDRSICLWNPFRDDMKDGFLIKRYKGPHSNAVNDVSISSDNQSFVSCGEERDIFLWDVSNARLLRRYYGHSQRVNCVCLNNEGSVFASGSYDTTVKLWDTRSRNSQCIQTMNDATDSVTSVCMDDTCIISGSVDGCIRTYDIRAGQLTTEKLPIPVCSVALSRDNQCIVASTTSSTLVLFERKSGTLLNEYKGHVCEEFQIESVFNNTDEYLITGSENGNIVIYNLISTKAVNTLSFHTRPVCTVRQHPDQSLLIAGSYDGVVSVWE